MIKASTDERVRQQKKYPLETGKLPIEVES
jgi:hypothetical protein